MEIPGQFSTEIDMPVIYASGNPANDHRRVAGSVFLRKPVAVSELTATCRKVLARPSQL
jgi:hypothetical protein